MQVGNYPRNFGPPCPVAKLPASFLTDDPPKSASISTTNMAQLERYDHVLRNKGGAEARAQPKEEHPSPFITSKRLHRGVVDHPYGLVKSGGEVETDPTGT